MIDIAGSTTRSRSPGRRVAPRSQDAGFSLLRRRRAGPRPYGPRAFVGGGLYNAARGLCAAVLGGGYLSSADSNFRPVDGEALLEALGALKIESWNYKTEHDSVRHIGPMAQDFRATFGGSSDRAIATVDPDGIALAAIQELHRTTQMLKAKSRELEALQVEVDRLREGSAADLAGLRTDLDRALAEIARLSAPRPGTR